MTALLFHLGKLGISTRGAIPKYLWGHKKARQDPRKRAGRRAIPLSGPKRFSDDNSAAHWEIEQGLLLTAPSPPSKPHAATSMHQSFGHWNEVRCCHRCRAGQPCDNVSAYSERTHRPDASGLERVLPLRTISKFPRNCGSQAYLRTQTLSPTYWPHR